MAHVFERNYVDEQNKGYSAGDIVPEYIEVNEIKLNFLKADGIVKEVESIASFMKKMDSAEVVEVSDEEEIADEVERLDPDKKRRRK